MTDVKNFDDMTKQEFINYQIKETVDQSIANVPGRLTVITCRCGCRRGIVNMFQCLYCREWFCHLCAEVHFGKTVKQYRKENPL